MARNNPEIPSEALDEVAKAMSVKRTAVVVKATKVVSWDHQETRRHLLNNAVTSVLPHVALLL